MKHKEQWVSISDAESLTGIRAESFHVINSKKKPNFIRNVGERGLLQIDVGYIFHTRQKNIRTVNIAHDIYYYLSINGMKDMDMAREISLMYDGNCGSWCSFLYNDLFINREFEVGMKEVPKTVLKFIKYFEDTMLNRNIDEKIANIVKSIRKSEKKKIDKIIKKFNISIQEKG